MQFRNLLITVGLGSSGEDHHYTRTSTSETGIGINIRYTCRFHLQVSLVRRTLAFLNFEYQEF